MGPRLGIFTRCSGSQFEFQALFATMTRLHHQKLTHVWYLPDRMASIGLGWRWVFCAGLTRKTDGLEASDVLLHFRCFSRDSHFSPILNILRFQWYTKPTRGNTFCSVCREQVTASKLLKMVRSAMCVCVYIYMYMCILYPPPHDLPWVILDFWPWIQPLDRKKHPGMLDLGSRALLWDNCSIYI